MRIEAYIHGEFFHAWEIEDPVLKGYTKPIAHITVKNYDKIKSMVPIRERLFKEAMEIIEREMQPILNARNNPCVQYVLCFESKFNDENPYI